MKGLKTLVLMQLKDKLDFSFAKSKKQLIFKIVMSIIKFVAITAVIYAGFYLLSFLRLVARAQGIPQNFFAVLITIMLLLSIVVCTFGLVKNLYMTKDNALLLTLPVSRTATFTSKLIVYYIYEFIRNITYLLPVLVAYGMINSLPFYFYFWIIFMLFIITALPVVIGALLSIPTVFILNFIKQHKFLEYILFVLLIGGTVTGLVFLINALPANFDLIGTWGATFFKVQDFMNRFIEIFMPFAWVAIALVGGRYGVVNEFMTGTQLLYTLGIIGVIVVVIAITYAVVRPLFFKMASSPFEYKKVKVTKKYSNKKQNVFISTVKKDLLLGYRTSGKMWALLIIVIGLPLAILLLNKIYAAMDTRLTGAYMAITFNALMMLLFVLSSNATISHIYSEEGASSYLLRTHPKPQLQTLFSKLIINIIFVSLSLLVAVMIFSVAVGYTWQGIIVFLSLECFYLGHLLWSAERDIMNPQTAQYQTVGTHFNNPNDIKTTIFAFIISAAVAFAIYFLIGENENILWFKILLIGGLFLALRIWLYINKIKVYYKEKV